MGARIFPIKEDCSDMPYSESVVYDALSKLGNNFVIFHSVQWIKRSNKWKSTWKENDFLILNRNLGALVLEVKGGNIDYKDGVFYQTNSSTKEVSILNPKKRNDPLSQAIDGVYHYRKMIGKLKSDLDDRFPIEAAVWFSSCNISEKRSDFPLAYREADGAILGYEDFTRGNQAIYDIFNFYESREKVDITDEEFNLIIDSIAMDFELIAATGVKKGELDHAFLKLTNEQTGLLDYISEQNQATIQGVAGTGKTLIAKEAARRFGIEGRKVLFLCYNKFLFQYLKKQFPYKNVTYYNIHSFINTFGEGRDISTIEGRVETLMSIDWDKLDFDDVIIDEAQDFHNNEIIYFKDFMELKEGHLLIFYDKNQLLTTKEVPTWIRESECKLILTKNCRNTYEIALTSYNVIDVELSHKIMMVNGEKPSICFVKGDPIGKIRNILLYLTDDQNGYEYRDIVILSLKREDSSIMKDVNKIFGIPITREKTNSSVLFTTSKKFKGLESRAIIIIDIDVDCFCDEEKKRNFYVACSRATQNLTLFVNGDDEMVKKMADAIGGSGHFASQGKIAMKTQTTIKKFDNI